MKKKAILIPVIAIAALLLVFAVAYFALLRQPDSKYESFDTDAEVAQTARDAILQGLTRTSPIYLNEENLAAYEKHYTSFSEAIASLGNNPIVQSDRAVKSAYEKNLATLRAYEASNDDLIKSIKLYIAMGSACRDMGSSLDEIRSKGTKVSAASLKSAMKGCEEAATAAENAPDDLFKKIFLTNYVACVNSLMNAYEQQFASAGTKATPLVEKTWNDLLSLNGTNFDLVRSPDPMDVLTNLQTVASQQKSKIVR